MSRALIWRVLAGGWPTLQLPIGTDGGMAARMSLKWAARICDLLETGFSVQGYGDRLAARRFRSTVRYSSLMCRARMCVLVVAGLSVQFAIASSAFFLNVDRETVGMGRPGIDNGP